MDIPAAPPTPRETVAAAQVPVFISNRNRLTSTRSLIEWLFRAGTQRIVILDNDSTYPPLLEYYDRISHAVSVKRQENLGPWAFWEQGMHLEQRTPYVVTDSDLVPADCCPMDLIEKILSILSAYPECGKVGPGLRLDNLPDLSRDFITHGDGKEWKGEEIYWKDRHPSGAFKAPIDTTFAMYAKGSPWVPAGWYNLRIDTPYVVEHTPWYVDKLTDEEKYYREHADSTWSHISWPSPLNDHLKGSE